MVESTASPISHVPNHTPIDRSTWEAIKDKLPNSLFEKNRARFYQIFKERCQVEFNEQNKAVALFKGSSEVPLYSTDFCYP